MKERNYLKIVRFDRVTSTNDRAYRLADKGAKEITVVWAKGQRKGKGRRGRKWHSPYNKGLYISFIFTPEVEVERVNLLGMAIAVAVVYALRGIVSVKIKWPNDIVCNNKKIGGVLIESRTSLRYPEFVVVGLGLNINALSKDLPSFATSLLMETGKEYSIDKIFKLILKEVIIWYRYFKKKDYAKILKNASECLDTLGKRVLVRTNKGIIEGFSEKIGDKGELFIRGNDNVIRKVNVWSVAHLRYF